VHTPAAGTYAMTVRFANNQQIVANHYNPDLMTAPADIVGLFPQPEARA